MSRIPTPNRVSNTPHGTTPKDPRRKTCSKPGVSRKKGGPCVNGRTRSSEGNGFSRNHLLEAHINFPVQSFSIPEKKSRTSLKFPPNFSSETGVHLKRRASRGRVERGRLPLLEPHEFPGTTFLEFWIFFSRKSPPSFSANALINSAFPEKGGSCVDGWKGEDFVCGCG